MRNLKNDRSRSIFFAEVRGLSVQVARLPQLVQLGHTLHAWRDEIARMWRFSRNNGITGGFHNKMETINRQAYGFRNFKNYRMRVRVLCS